jgi:hypothetical protein
MLQPLERSKARPKRALSPQAAHGKDLNTSDKQKGSGKLAVQELRAGSRKLP